MENNNSQLMSIKRTLYKSTKLSIEFFMYMPNALKQGNSININVNPIVFFRYVNPYIARDQKTVTDNVYKMSPKNYFKVVTFFNTIVGWFHDEKLKDLYFINENNELIFNADYKHLYSSLSPTKYDPSMMKAIPNIITYESEKYEGIYLYINKFENLIMITKEEIEVILQLLKDFNFTNEIAACIAMSNYIERTGNYTTDTYLWNNITRGYGSTPFDKK